MPRVSPFSSAFAKVPSAPLEIDRILDAIKNGKWGKLVTELRGLEGESYKTKKLRLPGFKASGIFHNKSDEGFVEHSGIVQIDIDFSLNPDTPYKEMWGKTLGMPNLYAAFRSPSGKGVKALIRCNPTREDHAGSYLAAANWFADRGIKVDRQVCALSQLCFCSFDPDLYINRKARPVVPVECPISSNPLVEYEDARTDEEILADCVSTWPDIFPDLWDGNFEGDHSSADHQLIAILRENCFSSERVAELFQQSGLYRPEKHHGKTREYVFRSLAKCSVVAALSLFSEIPEDPEDPSPPKKAKHGGWAWQTAAEIGEWKPEDDNYVVKRLLYESTVSCIYGPPGSGKTFCISSMAAAICTGIDWQGHKVSQGAAMYMGLEGHEGVTKRIQGMKKEGHLTDEAAALFARIICKKNAFNLLNAAHVKKAVETVKAFEAECGHKVKILIIDTLARATPGGDENSTKDMGVAIINAQAIADQTGCAVVIVHHSGKDLNKGMRGSTALLGAFDSTFEVSRHPEDQTIRVFTVKKQRDETDTGDLYFRLVIVILGMDNDGEAVTTCLLQFLEDHQIPVKQEKGSKAAASITPLVPHIPEEGVELAALAAATGTPKSTLQRRVKELIEQGDLRKDDAGRIYVDDSYDPTKEMSL